MGGEAEKMELRLVKKGVKAAELNLLIARVDISRLSPFHRSKGDSSKANKANLWRQKSVTVPVIKPLEKWPK